MQAYDIIMLVVLGAATLFGMIKGFAWQVASLASIVMSYVVAYKFRDVLAAKIQAEAPWNLFLAMLLLYAGTSFVIWFGFRMVSTSIDRVRLRDFDRQMGALFGLGKGLIYCLLITMFAITLLGARQQQAIVESRSGRFISSMLAGANGIMLPKEIEAIVRPHLDRVKERLANGANATPTNQNQSNSGFPSTGPSSDISSQLNQLGNAWANGQGGQNGFPDLSQIPTGLPTSQSQPSAGAVGNALNAARDILGWSTQNNASSPSGQGGWPQPGATPLPQQNGFPDTLQPQQNFPPLNSAPIQPGYQTPNYGAPNYGQQPSSFGEILPY